MLLASGSARAADPELWTVLPFVVHGVDAGAAATFRSLVADELRRQRGARIVPSSSQKPCRDARCAGDAGFAVGAWHVAFGSIGRLGTKIVVQATIINLQRSPDSGFVHRASVERIEDLDEAATTIVGSFGDAAPVLVRRQAPVAFHPAAPPRRRASFLSTAGRVLTFTFGGLALAAGTTFLSVGLGVESKGFIYAGIPSAAVGTGLITLGVVAAPEGRPLLSRAGRVISYTMGGIALVTGTALLAVGKGIDNDPMASSAVPPMVGGGALIMLGILGSTSPTSDVAVLPTFGGAVAVARF